MNGQQLNEQPDEAFETLLNFMRDSRGFDFTGYKRTSLMRRVRHRMTHAGFESYEEYLDHLQASADEFNALFNTILINVTSFFRDAPAWDCIRDEVVPAILAERGPNDPIRVWSAGCASGQEAYTTAMLLAEAMGARCLPAAGEKSTRPTSTRTRWPRRAPRATRNVPSSRCRRSC